MLTAVGTTASLAIASLAIAYLAIAHIALDPTLPHSGALHTIHLLMPPFSGRPNVRGDPNAAAVPPREPRSLIQRSLSRHYNIDRDSSLSRDCSIARGCNLN